MFDILKSINKDEPGYAENNIITIYGLREIIKIIKGCIEVEKLIKEEKMRTSIEKNDIN